MRNGSDVRTDLEVPAPSDARQREDDNDKERDPQQDPREVGEAEAGDPADAAASREQTLPVGGRCRR